MVVLRLSWAVNVGMYIELQSGELGKVEDEDGRVGLRLSLLSRR